MGNPANHNRVAVVGASTLRGKELISLIEESSRLSADIHLLDDESAGGLLTEAGGEPTVVQTVDAGSFDGVRFAFFAAGPEFVRRHSNDALRSGATVIDLSGALAEAGVAWIPALRSVLAPPRPAAGKVFESPFSATIIACTLAAALRKFPLERVAITFFQPVSERGQAGIDELESQTVSLLSLKPISQQVFDAQVAFNLLGSYGNGSQARLADICKGIASQTSRYLAGRVPVPAIHLVQVPAFYGYAFSAYVELGAPAKPEEIEAALTGTGLGIAAGDPPSNVSVAGERGIVVGHPELDANVAGAWWLWGAADNVRLGAANAVSIAETLLAS